MKKLIAFIIHIIIVVTFTQNVLATEPYENYTYDINGKVQAEPQAYVPYKTISGRSLNIKDFNSPKDIFVANDGMVYIADSGNNRIVILDDKLNFKSSISAFYKDGKLDQLKNPNGIYVTKDNIIYVADTDNARVIALTKELKVYIEILKPQSKLLTNDFAFAPVKVAVDSAERVFVVSKNVNQGMIEYDRNGEFVGFFGPIVVSADLSQILWKMVATKAQKERMSLAIPTEYSSVDIDKDGFIYGTVSAVDPKNFNANMLIHRLNPMGIDILKRNGFNPPMGDVEFAVDPATYTIKPSLLCDIAVREYGIYSVLDSRMGRVFTYDDNGNLLYVFGSIGSSLGQFGTPEAIDIKGDNYLVIDSKYNWIVMFKPTTYAKTVTDAVGNFYKRNYSKTDELWKIALKYTAKSDIAYDGMGRSLIKKEDYASALKYLKLSNDRVMYSYAFEYYRSQIIDKNFTLIIVGSAFILICLIILEKVRKNLKAKKGRK